MYRIGMGSGVGEFQGSGPLIVGGVTVENSHGLKAPWDGDIVSQAVGDALLGAMGLGGLSEQPTHNEENKNISSADILVQICQNVWSRGYKVVNVDVTFLTSGKVDFKMSRENIRQKIAAHLNIEKNLANFKTTNSNDDVAHAQAVVLVEKKKYD